MEVAVTVELPSHTLELPISDAPTHPISLDRHASANSQFSEQDPEEFASEAGVYHGSKLSISWKIVNSTRAIELAPLELDAKRLVGTGSRLKLSSPFAIVPHCTAVSETGDALVVDIITTVGCLYTVLVPYSWLASPNSKPSNPEVQISRPYTFDLIAPKLLKAVNAKTLVVGLVDGSLARLDRPSPLKPLVHHTLADYAHPKVGRTLSRLFKMGGHKVPGIPSLSMDTPVAIEILQEQIAVSYSVDNTVRVWSLVSNSCVQLIKSSESSKFPLILRPASYVSSIGSQVALAFPNQIKVYELLETKDELVEKLSIDYNDNGLQSWFLTSLNLLENGSMLIAFKLNMSARIYIVNADKWTLVGGYDHASLLDLPTDVSVEAIRQRVMLSSLPAISLALTQIAPNAPTLKSKSEEEVSRIVASSIPEETSDDREHALSTQWLRLDTLCREIDARGSELLGIVPALATPKGMFFWNLRVAGLSLLSTDMHADRASKEDGESEALEIAGDLLSSVPRDAVRTMSTMLLSSSLLMDRIDAVCAVLRNYLDQVKLNDVGRAFHGRVTAAIRNYIEHYGPQTSNPSDTSSADTANTELSDLGLDAVSNLVRDYAATQVSEFQTLALLAVIALVEGWFSDENDADILKSAVACLRRFAIVSELGEDLRLRIGSVHLEVFGKTLAQQLIAEPDEVSLLSALLPPHVTEFTKGHLEKFETVAGFCEPSSELVVLQSFAALAAGQDGLGIELAQRVSLSGSWPSTYGKAPATQSAWFLEVAKYALSVNASGAALWLTQYGESFSSLDDPSRPDLLDYLFEIAIASGDISTAYTALTRRFKDPAERDESQVQSWLLELLNAAARKSVDDARLLISTYPFIGLATSLQRLFNNTASFGAIPSYKLMYAWHVEHENYIGAAQAIYNHIIVERGIDPVRKAELYTVCLNALAVADPDSRWLGSGERIVTYDDIKVEQKALLSEMASQI